MYAGFVLQPQQVFAAAQPAGETKLFPLIYPMGGINAVDPLAALDPQFCTASYNIIPDGRGGRVRSGYQTWASSIGADVLTLIPFEGLDATNNALFAVTKDGIFDVTSGGSGPWTPEVAFSITTGKAGYGVWTSFTSDSGPHYGFYADEANGLYRRQEAGTWAAVTDITGVDEEDLVFVVEHKGRLWFVERNSANAWFLAAGTISGAATKHNFGNKFQHGGHLVGLWNWTVDGGTGVDDYLVAISSAGDVVAMRFEDPTDASTFQPITQYYVGSVPAGRRIAAASGGELFVLSQMGILPMSQLISGRPVQEQNAYLSRNITPLLTADMAATRTALGWELKVCASEQVFLLSTPKTEGYPFRQYALSTKARGWTTFRGLPYMNGEDFLGTFFLAGLDGYVYRFTGNQDDGNDIQFGMVSAFSDVGEPGQYHRVQFLRPVFRSSGAPSYNVTARYDYDLDAPEGALSPTTIGGSLWDVALWDTATWGGSGATLADVFGGQGLGRAIAVALIGQSAQETLLLRIDVMFDSGGML